MPNAIPPVMRYVVAREAGPPDVLALAETATPAPKPGEVLIEVAYAGVNRPDCIQRAGQYPPPPDASPILGLEVAGTVVALGEGVTECRLGDQVCALTPGGGYAEYCATPAAWCLPYPEGLSALEAASLPENYFTVWNNLFDRVHLKAGETVLIHGGSGGIGLAAIQLAHAIGATARSRPSAATTKRRSARRWAPTTRSTTGSRISPSKSRGSPASAASTSSSISSAATISRRI